MKLQRMVRELRNNILRDVSDEIDPQTAGQLWDDDTLVDYINDGQNQFAVRTLCFRDERTPAVTQITLVAGQEIYDLDSRVRAVFGARVPGERVLKRTTYAALHSARGDVTTAYVTVDNARPGPPTLFYTDRETDTIGLYPPPDDRWDGKILQLRVGRLPLEQLDYTNMEMVPEIREEYHLDILEWAAWRALRNHDVDAENMGKASAHKKRFEDAVKALEIDAKRMLAQDIQFDLRNNWDRTRC